MHNSKNILLVDDEYLNRFGLKKIFTRLGHNVEEAENGLEAVQKSVLGKFDVIFMDVDMPIMDGITAAKKIKNNPENKSKIIGISGRSDEESINACLENGMIGLEAKPILIDRILTYLD